MSCDKCDNADSSRVAYFRIGNGEIGWGNLGVIGCDKHVGLLQKILRGEVLLAEPRKQPIEKAEAKK